MGDPARVDSSHAAAIPWRGGRITWRVAFDGTMRPIRYGDRTVALCDGDDVLLAPAIAALKPEHPTRRFVSML